MRRTKGQVSLVAQVLLVAVVSMMAFATFVLIVASNGSVQENIQPRINYAMSEVKTRSVITSVLNGKMSRTQGIPKAKYGNSKAKEVISVYLSQGHFRQGTETIRSSELESDIGKYVKQRMDVYFGNSYYNFRLEGDKRSMSVESDREFQGTAVSYGIPIALTGDKAGEVVLVLEEAGDVYG